MKRVLLVAVFVCFVAIGSACNSSSEEVKESGMMQNSQDNQEDQSGKTDWEQDEQKPETERKPEAEQKPETEQKPGTEHELESAAEEKNIKTPQPNTESGWGPIT